MNKYTVIGCYTSGFDLPEKFAHHVLAEDAEVAQKQIEQKFEEHVPVVCAVAKGFIVLEGEEVPAEHEFTLTAYLDGGGSLQFHVGPAGDFDRDVAASHDVRLLKEFVIDGELLSTRGETEPISVR